jgi:IclR family acetate operon transcriptional repressor
VRTVPAAREKPERYFTRAVGKALEIVRLLERAPEPPALAQVAAAIGLTKPSAFRLLCTLEVEGYVARTDEGRYRLEPALEPLLSAQLHAAVRRAAAPHLKVLAQRTRETVGLALLHENHMEVAAVIESPQVVRTGNTVGRILPPHSSSLGKAMLAFMDADARDRLIEAYGLYRYTPRTIVDTGELRKELDRTRGRGHALDLEENALGGVCVGAPLFDAGGGVCGAISVSLPKARWEGAGQGALVKAVRKAAAAISRALAGRPRR